jgi:hypothetical protein
MPGGVFDVKQGPLRPNRWDLWLVVVVAVMLAGLVIWAWLD